MNQIIICAAAPPLDGMLICSGSEVSGAPDTIKLLPLGMVHSQKGDFLVDKESFDAINAEFQKRGLDVVIDYEHQTLADVQAPAGGWIKELFLEADAIAAKVEWTPQARQYLENKEYRYLSPVIMVRDRDKKAVRLHSAALTNKPAIDGMFPIVNSDKGDSNEGGQPNMDEFLKMLAQMLGLGEEATQEQVLQKLQTVVAKEGGEEGKGDDTSQAVANKTICDLLGVAPDAKTEDVAAAILKMRSPETQLELKVQTLEQRLAKQDAESLVSVALSTGKITLALKDWAMDYALRDPAGFTAFTEKVPQMVPLGELLPESSAPARRNEVDDLALQVCKQLGRDTEDLKLYGKDEE